MRPNWLRGKRNESDRRAAACSGNVAIVFGITLPIILGACGLGVDVGYWYYEARSLQSAADAAAYDGTVELKAGGSLSQITSSATAGATANGWSSANGTISVYSPPISGNYQNANSVEVVLTANLPRFFSALYAQGPVPASATAVATQAGGVACILALDPTARQAVTVSGSANLDAPGCNVVSDSDASNAIDMSGSAQLTAACIVSVGSAQTTAGLTLDVCTSPTNYAPAVPDPYASVPQPSPSGNCLTVAGGATSLSPGWYCHGLSTSWGPISFQPGLYMVTGGGLNLDAGTNATGTGVTFFVAGDQTAAISGDSVVNFSAPDSGTYAGILFFGDRGARNGNNNFSGASSSTLTGAIYFAANEVTFSGGASNTNCTQIVADTITISGTADFNGNCGGGQSGAVRLVQ